ncbi:hypothetical protein [Amnibacterium endophyticum]|uniref:GIY-YIG domain-containing protein n=1 Tax=Amnibacterium endophyticum TaxID=2109337 RepID=A0ABW4LJ50_9MICO
MSGEHDGPRPWSRQALEHGGFAGFVPFSQLPEAGVPQAPGVYAVLRTSGAAPMFMRESSGGRFKGKDPAIAPEALERAWVDGPEVVYIGKATRGSAGRRGLEKRLDEYRRFGAGEPVGHWGGRAIWQLADRDELLVAWNATEEDAAAVESRMLGDFRDRYGVLPFANLRR